MRWSYYKNVGCVGVALIVLTDFEMRREGHKRVKWKVGAGVVVGGRTGATYGERSMQIEVFR